MTTVSDNGPQFRSNEMEQFTKNNGIQHKFTAPYDPATIEQAERFVQKLKKGLRCMQNETEAGDLNMKLNRLLMQYRKTPNSTTRQSPAEHMFNRPIRTRLNLMKRNITTHK
jgi:transposase InsO family protein